MLAVDIMYLSRHTRVRQELPKQGDGLQIGLHRPRGFVLRQEGAAEGMYEGTQRMKGVSALSSSIYV